MEYDPETGVFRWRVNRQWVKAGAAAGTKHNRGYWAITVDGRSYGAHRLAFLYMIGEWPKGQIDHCDRDRRNNRWGNLRPASHSQNCSNRSVFASSGTGIKGVRRRGNKFCAQIRRNGQTEYLGTFVTAAEAAVAFNRAARELHGAFASA
ncbi:MAG: HNH endonuclease [Rhodovulum sp.]|nr:HNH endonuclease [Rhodovulum sp.]